jgi:16S rRNA (guanine527-N7)-methyltransferase
MPSFINAVEQLTGSRLNEGQLAAFERYAAELADWNQRLSLTAIRDPEGVRIRHFLDSLSCLQATGDLAGQRVADVGAGAGFPGLPLKIVQHGMQLTLFESVAKKTAFLEHVVQVLGLEGVEVVTARAEEAGQGPATRERFDWAIARALAPMPVLAEYLLPLVRVGGHMLAQKGKEARLEAQAGQAAIELLGGQLGPLREVRVPGLDEERWLVVVNKVAETPAKYPRRPGMPAKRPLG